MSLGAELDSFSNLNPSQPEPDDVFRHAIGKDDGEYHPDQPGNGSHAGDGEPVSYESAGRFPDAEPVSDALPALPDFPKQQSEDNNLPVYEGRDNFQSESIDPLSYLEVSRTLPQAKLIKTAPGGETATLANLDLAHAHQGKNSITKHLDHYVEPYESVFQIEVDKIDPNPYQPRRYFDDDELRELAQSIREYGIIQPIIVSKVELDTIVGTSVRYQLIAGERRLRAARLIGMDRVPAVVRGPETDKRNLELAIVENVQRSDLNSIETARAYARLQDEFNLTQREIAARVGKSRESVANSLRLLGAPSYIQEALLAGKINESQARILLGIGDPAEQERVFQQLLYRKMSVRRLKEHVAHGVDPQKNFYEKRLEERVGAPVHISKRGDKGKVVIEFFSEEELRGVLDRLLGEMG